MWLDNVSDTGLYVVVVRTLVIVAAGFVASWAWKRDNERRIARYEAWPEQEARRRRSEEAPPELHEPPVLCRRPNGTEHR